MAPSDGTRESPWSLSQRQTQMNRLTNHRSHAHTHTHATRTNVLTVFWARSRSLWRRENKILSMKGDQVSIRDGEREKAKKKMRGDTESRGAFRKPNEISSRCWEECLARWEGEGEN